MTQCFTPTEVASQRSFHVNAAGFCARWDGEELGVKNTNSFDEQYDILLADNHARRGLGSYKGSCYPANFPVDPTDVIAYIRVFQGSFKSTDVLHLFATRADMKPVEIGIFVNGVDANNARIVTGYALGTIEKWAAAQARDRGRSRPPSISTS